MGLRPDLSRPQVVLRYEVAVVAVVLSVTTHMLTSTTRDLAAVVRQSQCHKLAPVHPSVLYPALGQGVIPARMDEECLGFGTLQLNYAGLTTTHAICRTRIVESLPWDGLPEDLFTWTRAS